MDRVGGVGGDGGGGRLYYRILDFKAKIFKRFHWDVGIDSVWGINKAGIDYIK